MMTFPAKLKIEFIDTLTRNKISYRQGWTNFMGNVRNPSAVVVDVDSEAQVQLIMKEVKRMNDNRTPKDKITLRATAGWEDKDKSVGCCLFPWSKVQEEEYAKGSFSFSEVVGGRTSPESEGTDIILRFKKKFHKAKVLGSLNTKPTWLNPDNPIHQLPASLVEVSAGMQIAEYAEFLRKNNLSSSTLSMLSWASLVGLLGPGGHGTGRDEPAVSGLIESIRVCDMDGTIRELTPDHPDFQTLCAAHSGFLGVILSVKMRVVKAYNLRETIAVFHNTEEMNGKLGDILKNNQYVSVMGMPSASILGENVHQWQVRMWNYTTDKPTQNSQPTYSPTSTSFVQELGLRLGEDLMDFLVNSDLKGLLPEFMLIAAAQSIEERGTKPIVDFENHITHPQVAFPEKLRDVDYFIPVKDDKAGEHLEAILQQIEYQVNKASRRGEYPITYAVYVRYLKGTNGGLSPTGTSSSDERIIALDVVTHPQTPGIVRFEKEFLGFLKEQEFEVRNHLGKQFPAGVVHYSQFLDPKNIKDFIEAAERWNATPNKNDGAERLAMAPYNTNYFQEMLDLNPGLERELEDKSLKEEPLSPKMKSIEYTKEECVRFLTRLYEVVDLMPVQSEAAKNAKAIFLKTCQDELEIRRIRDLVIS
ncbi:L-gulono-gamma-lactone oxidase [Fluoribacter gormanii]|nr:L-gulono-gamma-lactone oxidase [Fluoribacter gormanii]